MKYNLFTTLNTSYFKFGKILINSYIDRCDISKLNSFIIHDTGLTDSEISYIKNKMPKVNFISKNLKTSFKGGTAGEDWHKNVTYKTIVLNEIVENYTPTIMIDSDCMFCKDIYDIIDFKYDIQLCHRPKHKVPYLASFVSVNNNEKKVIDFLKFWQDKIQNTKKIYNGQKHKEGKGKLAARESPSLGVAVKENINNLNIGNLSYGQVSSTLASMNDKTYVVHFKGNAFYKDSDAAFKGRVSDKKEYNEYVKKYIED